MITRLRAVSPAFRALDGSSWLLFLGLYAHFKVTGEDASPVQTELEAVTALSSRTLHRHIRVLVEREILRVDRVRSRAGYPRRVYALGAVAHVALDELGARRTPTTPLRGAEARLVDMEKRLAKLETRSARPRKAAR